MPAGTRTAPTVSDITSTAVGVTIHLIDASGDLTTDYILAETADLADVQALVTAYQATTQSSVCKVSVTQEFEGEADTSNAQAGFRGGIQNGINLLFKDVTAQAKQTPRVVAPIADIMQGNQDIPLLTGVLNTLVAQYLTMLGGAYELDSLQFTTRRERANNPRIRT